MKKTKEVLCVENIHSQEGQGIFQGYQNQEMGPSITVYQPVSDPRGSGNKKMSEEQTGSTGSEFNTSRNSSLQGKNLENQASKKLHLKNASQYSGQSEQKKNGVEEKAKTQNKKIESNVEMSQKNTKILLFSAAMRNLCPGKYSENGPVPYFPKEEMVSQEKIQERLKSINAALNRSLPIQNNALSAKSPSKNLSGPSLQIEKQSKPEGEGMKPQTMAEQNFPFKVIPPYEFTLPLEMKRYIKEKNILSHMMIPTQQSMLPIVNMQNFLIGPVPKNVRVEPEDTSLEDSQKLLNSLTEFQQQLVQCIEEMRQQARKSAQENAAFMVEDILKEMGCVGQQAQSIKENALKDEVLEQSFLVMQEMISLRHDFGVDVLGLKSQYQSEQNSDPIPSSDSSSFEQINREEESEEFCVLVQEANEQVQGPSNDKREEQVYQSLRGQAESNSEQKKEKNQEDDEDEDEDSEVDRRQQKKQLEQLYKTELGIRQSNILTMKMINNARQSNERYENMLKNRIKDQQTELKDARDEIALLKAQLAERDAQISQLSQKYEGDHELTQKFSQLSQNYEKLGETCNELKQSNVEKTKEIAEMKEVMATFTKKFQSLQSKQESLEKKNALMRSEINEHSRAIECHNTPQFYQGFDFIRDIQRKSKLALELTEESQKEQKKLSRELQSHRTECNEKIDVEAKHVRDCKRKLVEFQDQLERRVATKSLYTVPSQKQL